MSRNVSDVLTLGTIKNARPRQASQGEKKAAPLFHPTSKISITFRSFSMKIECISKYEILFFRKVLEKDWIFEELYRGEAIYLG